MDAELEHRLHHMAEMAYREIGSVDPGQFRGRLERDEFLNGYHFTVDLRPTDRVMSCAIHTRRLREPPMLNAMMWALTQFYVARAIRDRANTVTRRVEDRDAAHARARETLKLFLSPGQRVAYEFDKSFVVLGGQTGKPYRIHPEINSNIEELRSGGENRWWCFVPAAEGLPIPDIQLMQKLCLEADEIETMKVAVLRRGPPDYHLLNDPRFVERHNYDHLADLARNGAWIDESAAITEAAWERLNASITRTATEMRQLQEQSARERERAEYERQRGELALRYSTPPPRRPSNWWLA